MTGRIDGRFASTRGVSALWTPDEHEAYGPLEPLDPKHEVPADAYVCVAHGGATIFEACKEGVGLARMGIRQRQCDECSRWFWPWDMREQHSRDTQRKDGE